MSKKPYAYQCKAKSNILREVPGAGYRPYATQVKDRVPERTLLELKQLRALLGE